MFLNKGIKTIKGGYHFSLGVRLRTVRTSRGTSTSAMGTRSVAVRTSTTDGLGLARCLL